MSTIAIMLLTRAVSSDTSRVSAPVEMAALRVARPVLRRFGAPRKLCRHREWTKFGVYSEDTFCRLVDDLC